MGNSMLVPLNDSKSSKGVIEFLLNMSLCDDNTFTLIHIFREPSSGEELMGKKFMAEMPARLEKMLEDTKQRLVEEKGFNGDNIQIELVKGYSSVSEGIIDYFKKGGFDMVVIGRKQMSKSEEFVLGDISAKLIRNLPKASILVVKSG
ncbi:MAG: universal stress protein [Desulfosalsimonadaceae bacterium]